MKPIDNTNGEDRAVTALLGKAAAFTAGVATKLFTRSAQKKPRGKRKPKPGLRSQRGSLVKGGLSHA
jgi:hypothetical protein